MRDDGRARTGVVEYDSHGGRDTQSFVFHYSVKGSARPLDKPQLFPQFFNESCGQCSHFLPTLKVSTATGLTAGEVAWMRIKNGFAEALEWARCSDVC